MKAKSLRYLMIVSLAIVLVFVTAGCGSKKSRDTQELIEEMVVDYAGYGDEASSHMQDLLKDLTAADADLGSRWEKIIDLWTSVNADIQLNYDILPDGLPDTNELCIVVLGFQLAPDGSMKDELINRLKVVLASAKKYPNAYIVCTGGGTAAENKSATEAGEMGKWLIANGVDENRVIVENKSITTAQNAMFTYDILTEKYPMVRQIAIVSSDYHIATGVLLFSAEFILRADDPDGQQLEVVSNAAWKAPSGTLSTMFQAGALIELSGDTETAFDIYYENYDIHDLPPLN